MSTIPNDRLKANVNYTIEDQGGSTIGVTRVNGKLYPAFGVSRLQTVRDINIRDDDVLLCGYPKTGCHWMFEVLRMLVTKTLTFSDSGKDIAMIDQTPDVILDSLPSPRVLNSHLWYGELPAEVKQKRNKIILTIRSPKDTVVSFYNHHKNIPSYKYHGLFDNFFKLFMDGNLEYENYFDFYRDWENAMASSQMDNEIYLVKYEDLKENPVAVILQIARFLDIPDMTQRLAENIAKQTDFRNMKNFRSKGRSDPHPVFRSGVVGDWTNWLTQEQSGQMDQEWAALQADCPRISSSY